MLLRNIFWHCCCRTIIFQNKDKPRWCWGFLVNYFLYFMFLGLIRYAMPWSLSPLSITLNAPLVLPIPCYALLTKVQIRYLMCGQNMPWESLTSTLSGLSTIQTILRPDHKCIWPPPLQVREVHTTYALVE